MCSEGQFDMGSSVLVKKFMRGVFNKQPALPKYRTTWHPDIVFNYLSSLSSNFYGDLVYKLKKFVGSSNFSAQFIKIISHYKKL